MNYSCNSFWLSLRCWLLLIGAALALAGCAVQPVTDITLSGVVRGEQTVLTGPVPQSFVQFVRNGASYTTINPGMVMQPGDTLSTGPDTSVVITYPGGTRAYVYPDSQVRIGSVFNDRGNVFIKKTKGAFKVRTKFLTAGSEGTQYWVDVKVPDQVKVVVVEGAVSLASNAATWPSLVLRADQQAVLRGASAPLLNAASAADIQRETEWVNKMDRLVPVRTSISPWAIAAAAAAVILINNHGADKPPGSTTTTAPPSSSSQ